MEYLQNMLSEKTHAVLSKFKLLETVPPFFVSNLLDLSSQLISGVERTELKQQELTELADKYMVRQYMSLSAVVQKRKSIKSEYSVNAIVSHLKSSLFKESESQETMIKLSILLESDSFLSTFLHDIINNMDRRRATWSEATLSIFSLLLNYGGPMTADLVSKNFGGPHLSTIYIKSRQDIIVENSLDSGAFANAANFYRNILKSDKKLQDIIFTLAVDATPILPLIRAKGNKLIGFATTHQIEISTAEEIIRIFKNKELTAAQQTYVFILTPLRKDIPYFILAAPPVLKGESHETVADWITNSIDWGIQQDIKIVGIAADGDSKIRSYFLKRFLNKDDNNLSINRDDFVFSLPKIVDSELYECPFPDPRHMIKKWRNQILNVKRFLVLGQYGVQLEHLMELSDCDQYKHTLGLWKTDIKVNDKQNVNAAVRLFDLNVQECLAHLNEEKFKGTIIYLKLGSLLYNMYFGKEMAISTRISYAWTLVQFIRLWKVWVQSSGYKLEKNFISDQTFKDVLIAGHSLILFSKLHHIAFRRQPFEPWMWGSDACEKVFAKARCFVRTKNNFCHAEFLDICRRLQKVSENERNPVIKTKVNKEPSMADISFHINNFDDLIEKEMENGDRSACELAVQAGLHTQLLKARIFKRTNSGKYEIKDSLAHDLLHIDCSNEDNNNQDEMKSLSNDEIESLNGNEIIQTTLGMDHQTIHSDDFQDLACTVLSADQPTTVSGVSSTCNSQKASPCDSHDHENISCAKKSRLSEKELDKTCDPVNSKLQSSCSESKKSTQIYYKGHWYHISKFVSWEQGKFYMPQQARLNRFYSNYVVFDKFVSQKELTPNEVHHNSFIASWKAGKYVFGRVKRIIDTPSRGKSAHPLFTWEKNSVKDVEIVIQQFSPLDSSSEGLSIKLKQSNNFIWTNGKEYVTIMEGDLSENTFTVSESCFKKLNQALEHLKKQDLLEEKRKREEKKRKEDEIKSGPPEKMTVAILKTILKENNIKFPSNARKADLMELVKKQMTGTPEGVTERTKLCSRKSKRRKYIYCSTKRTIFRTYVFEFTDFSKHYFTILLKFILEMLLLLGYVMMLNTYLWIIALLFYLYDILFQTLNLCAQVNLGAHVGHVLVFHVFSFSLMFSFLKNMCLII